MKLKFIVVSALLSLSSALFSQVENLGNPPSWSISSATNTQYNQMPAVNVQEQLDIDALNKANGFDKMLRFGFEHQVNINVLQAGTQISDGLGGVITQYAIHCPEALSINLIFDNFNLAQGAELYIYNENRTQYIGAHTAANNNVANALGTDLLKGDKCIIELYEPNNVVGNSILTLNTVVHGYRLLPELIEELQKGLNDSGDCNVDVNCPAGAGWENQRNAVAMLVNGGGFCSGSLVNSVTNTVGDVTPYFLTANHCGSSFNSTIFRFRWETAASDVSCATTANSANAPTNKFVNGSILRAADGNADFVLLELNSEPDPAWGIYYNGYNVTDDANVMAAGIHHPSGDIKKIAIEYQAPTKETTFFNGTAGARFWRIADWDVGVTEPGSSGSPLFDVNRRTIGVLSAGAAACAGTSDNNQFDIYGRLGVAWDEKSSINQQLKHWLDPNDTGTEILDGFEPLTGINTDSYAGLDKEQDALLLSIYPNPIKDNFTIEMPGNSNKIVTIQNALGQTVKEIETKNAKITLSSSAFTAGIYIINVKTQQKSISKRILVH